MCDLLCMRKVFNRQLCAFERIQPYSAVYSCYLAAQHPSAPSIAHRATLQVLVDHGALSQRPHSHLKQRKWLFIAGSRRISQAASPCHYAQTAAGPRPDAGAARG